MKSMLFCTCFFFCIGIFSCSEKTKTYIVAGQDPIIIETGNDLTRFLSQTYPEEVFDIASKPIQGSRNILLEVTNDEGLINDEAFKVTGEGQFLYIWGKTPRALRNGVYGLLKDIGWNFYLSFDVPPVEPKSLDFSAIQIENAPLKERRIIFNWHNFLSGCTGWDYEQWQQWIDNSSRIGFNTVMVHAYGNNPMHSFSYNGQDKELGYLTTTRKGRDWGAQHVNDVRLLHGGEMFADDEFGAEAAKVPEKERSQMATALMQKVFKHATIKGMDVCFALDIDTWMSNPQNIINSLPREALIEIGDYKTVNPEHPEGKKYYEAQLKKLLSNYPEINVLAAWMRRPTKQTGQGSIWLLHESNTLPEKWKKEYFDILKNHPDLKDERPYPGLFAISKIIEAYREILDEVRPEVELNLGSWEFGYTGDAQAFMPEYCGFIPLDWSYVFDNPEVINKLKEVGKNRKLYPIVWAHHDDHRYIGRPYIPFSNFNSLLDETNSSGYGIIHWTTHPLDLLFNNYENQVWQKSKNQTLEKASADFAMAMMKRDDKNLVEYYREWFANAPMFGRETTDYFMRLQEDYKLEGYGSSLDAIEKAKQRIMKLDAVDTGALNAHGIKEYQYQLGMEKFIVSFFTNHYNGHEAFKFLNNGEKEKALPFLKKLNPLETIGLYKETIEKYGATRGEEGILISLNLRWLPDYIDLKQRSGLDTVRINFQPTSHDLLAQGAGRNTFFMDKQKNLWMSLGEKELAVSAESNGKLPLENSDESWLNISGETDIPLTTIRSYDLPDMEFDLKIYFAPQSVGCQVQIIEEGEIIAKLNIKEGQTSVNCGFSTSGGKISLRFIPENGVAKVAGLIAYPSS